MKTRIHLAEIQRVHDEAARELEQMEALYYVNGWDVTKSGRIKDLYRQVEKTDRILNPVKRKK